MGTEKRDLILDMLARNKMGPATREAAKDVELVGDAADKASHQTEEFGKATVIAGEGAEKLGKESTELGRHMDKATDEIQKLERELESLARGFLATDVAAERLDISRGIRKAQNEIRRLNTSKGILEGMLPKDTEVDAAGRGFIKKLGGAISAGAGSLSGLASNNVGITVGAAIGAAAAPVLVSALSSALAAGAGAGFIGAGLGLAVSKDKGIQQAGARVGKHFIEGLQDSALSSFGGPIKTSLGILEQAGTRVTKTWDAAFKSLSGSIVPLTRDIVTSAELINNSLAGAASESGPALDGLGSSVKLLSSGVADFISIVSDGGPEAAGNLKVIAGVTADVARQSALLFKVVSDLSGSVWLTGGLLPLLRKHYSDVADATDTTTGATEDLSGALTDAEAAARGQTDALVGLNKELRAQSDPAFALIEAQSKLKSAQEAAAKATKKHGANSAEARKATRDLATAALDLQGKVGALGKDFDGKLTPAMRSSLKAGGLTERQINAVEREFGQAKKAGDRYAKTYAATTKVYGAKTARSQLYSVKEVADDIPRVIGIAMRITGNKSVSGSLAAFRKNARAGGGPVSKDQPYWVGEEGPELIMPTSNGMVLTAAQSRRAVARGGGGVAAGGGTPEVRVVFDVTGTEGKFKELVRQLVRTGGL